MRHTELTCKITGKQQPAGYSFNTNDYDHVQLIYVLEGCLHYEGHKPDETIDLGPNMLVLYNGMIAPPDPVRHPRRHLVPERIQR